MALSRQCRSCGDYHPETFYYKLKSSEDGLHPSCKQCCKLSRSLEAVRKRDKKSKLSVRQRVRAMNLGIVYEVVLLVEIFRKDRGMCYLCKKWVQPRKASMDHEVPLSKGGVHLYANVRLTHLKCNLRKGSRMHSE